MEPTSLLAEIIAIGGPVSAANYYDDDSFHTLEKHGFVAETGVVQSTHCDDCERPHDAEVVFEGGTYGIPCPDIGFIPKDRAELIAIRPNLGRLIESLATSLKCKRRKSSPIWGNVWRVGTLDRFNSSLTVYFHPTMRDEGDLQAFEAALRKEPKSQFGIILTATGKLTSPPFKAALLDECLTFSTATGQFEADTDLFVLADAPIKSKGGRPSLFADDLHRLINARIASREALKGQNQEANVIQSLYKEAHPDKKPPSISTIKLALRDN